MRRRAGAALIRSAARCVRLTTVGPHLPRPCASAAALCLIAATAPLAAASGDWIESPAAKVRLISRWSAVAPGDEPALGVEFALAPGWHVYWKNPGDAGYPPALELRSGALGTAELLYPAPRRFELAGGLEAIGYEREVVYPVALAAGSVGSGGAITATVDYLACAEQCVPFRQDLALVLPAAERSLADPETAPRLDAWRAKVPRALDRAAGERVAARLEHAGETPELELRLALAVPGAEAPAPALFFESSPAWIVERPRFEREAGSLATFRVRIRPRDPSLPAPDALRLGWTAAGFARAGAPLAWSGSLDLATNSGSARGASAWSWLAAAIFAALFVVVLVSRRSRAVAVVPR